MFVHTGYYAVCTVYWYNIFKLLSYTKMQTNVLYLRVLVEFSCKQTEQHRNPIVKTWLITLLNSTWHLYVFPFDTTSCSMLDVCVQSRTTSSSTSVMLMNTHQPQGAVFFGLCCVTNQWLDSQLSSLLSPQSSRTGVNKETRERVCRAELRPQQRHTEHAVRLQQGPGIAQRQDLRPSDTVCIHCKLYSVCLCHVFFNSWLRCVQVMLSPDYINVCCQVPNGEE